MTKVAEEESPPGDAASIPGRVRYFAYGSNMDPATFGGRRGLSWTRAEAAVVRGWRLVTDKPSLLGGSQGMASIIEDAHAFVWGVLYEIAEADFEHLELTEGVRIDHYRRVVVPVRTASGRNEQAFTLASNRRDPVLKPSTRYRALLVAGAEAHGLPQDWIAHLNAIDAFEEGPELATMRPLVDRAMKKPA